MIRMNGFLTTAAAMMLSVHPVVAAAGDAAHLDPTYAEHCRYLRLDDVPQDYRSTLIRLLCLEIAGVSQASEITPPFIVPGTDLSLVRINTHDYGSQFARTWEKLVSPWDHLQVEEAVYEEQYQWYGYYDQFGKPVYTRKEAIGKKLVGNGKRKAVPSPFLMDTPQLQKQYEWLATRLGGSNAIIIRASWFINRIQAQQNRSPTGYLDFLGVKTEKDFQALGEFVEPKLRQPWRAAVSLSGVTTQPRAIRRDGGPDSPYWRTFDFQLATGENNPLEVFGDDIERAFRDPKNKGVTASEQYILLPNGMWATGAFGNDGAAQAVAPNTVAGDKRSPSNDLQIHVNISCKRCHEDGGLKPVNNWAKGFFPPPLELHKGNQIEARLFREQYGRDLAGKIDRDKLEYNSIVERWTGWKSKEYAAKAAAEWNRYENMVVGRKELAVLLNTTEEKLFAAVDMTVRANNAHRVLSNVVIRGETIPIRQAETVAPIAQLALRGLQP